MPLNTLVLAYVGSSLTILLLLGVDGAVFADSVNSEAISEQIISTLLGSIGLVAAVPITTALGALLATSLPPKALACQGRARAPPLRLRQRRAIREL